MCWDFLWVVGVCVPDVPLCRLHVTVLFSSVNGDCEILYDSDCEVVELQTRFLSIKTRSVFLWKVKKT